jgi:uncharacterized protein YidB (DUF937 family)
MGALLTVEGLAHAYAGALAVRDVSFSVGEGEVVALVGANGAGKSTSVKCVAGALRPARGSIRFAGTEIAGHPVHEVVERGITLAGLLDKLQQSGLGAQAASWVGTGANLPVEGRQLQQALGDDWMATLAAQLGTSSGQASQSVATMLPELVDRLTPEGKVGDLQSLAPRNLESLLGGKLFG